VHVGSNAVQSIVLSQHLLLTLLAWLVGGVALHPFGFIADFPTSFNQKKIIQHTSSNFAIIDAGNDRAKLHRS
jgi:hypothetical protein